MNEDARLPAVAGGPPRAQAAAVWTVDRLRSEAEAIARSGVLGIKRPEQALGLMLLCRANGQDPILNLTQYHVLTDGRATIKAEAARKRFKDLGGVLRYLELTDQRVVVEARHGEWSATVDWDLDRAKRAGLVGRDNWKAYPRQMLAARATLEAIRLVAPEALDFLYSPEELAGPAFHPETVDQVLADVEATAEREEPPKSGGRLELRDENSDVIAKFDRGREWLAAYQAELARTDDRPDFAAANLPLLQKLASAVPPENAPELHDALAEAIDLARRRDNRLNDADPSAYADPPKSGFPLRESSGTLIQACSTEALWLERYRRLMAKADPDERAAIAAANIDVMRRIAAEGPEPLRREIAADLEASEALAASAQDDEPEQPELLG